MAGNKINEIKELERSLGLIFKTFLLSNSESQANDTGSTLPGLIAIPLLKNFVLDLKSQTCVQQSSFEQLPNNNVWGKLRTFFRQKFLPQLCSEQEILAKSFLSAVKNLTAPQNMQFAATLQN